ncbi:hypothetical protein BDZ45DRAFT_680080 [Acephala macrosclerotiorum]|nr:hypothetical protein BDZ45DRAFT_680080 [Acephala macrosclerotiorum]
MTGYKRLFLGCWVSLDEQDRLCEVSLDSSTVEEVSGPSDQQIDSIFQAFRHHRVEIRREGDVPSNPIIILEDTPSVTVAPDTNTPPQSPPQQLEKRPRPDSYSGMMTRSSSRTKKVSSDDPDHSTSRGTSGLEEIPSTPESTILEEHSPQPNNDIALVDSHLPVESSASTVKENPQHVSPAPELFPTDEKADPAVSTDELVTTSGAATGSASSIILNPSPEADTQPECQYQTCPLVACTHPVSTVEPTDSTLSPNASGYTLEVSQQTLLDTPDQTTSTHCPASHDSTIRSPSITSQTKYRPVSKETQELYLDGDAIPIMSGILQTSLKYHEKTADFQDGDCLVTKVLKGMGAIMKPPADLTAYFDLAVRNSVKRELKKEQAGLESLQAINLWKETFRYNFVEKLAEANIRTYYRENPGSAADASQAEAEAVKELVDVVSKGRSEENYRKHHRFWKFLHDVRVEGTNNEMEDAEARMLKDGLTHILLFRTKGFNRRFFNKTKDSLQTVRKWNQVYHPYMKEVQMRVLAERASDFSGSTDWHQTVVRKESQVSKVARINWVNGTRALNQEEQQSYVASFDRPLQPEELSSQSTTEVLRDGIDGQSERNNAIYICLVPYEGPLNGKRKYNGTPASRVVAAPCPVVPILPGDFLGVMSGQLRYTSKLECSDEAIQGPDPKQWLDFSKITGKLSCMRSADLGTEANVTLTWKKYNDQHGMNWRVEVVAAKEIWPFEELVRPNSDFIGSHL